MLTAYGTQTERLVDEALDVLSKTIDAGENVMPDIIDE